MIEDNVQVHDVVDEDSKDFNAHAAAVWSAAEVHDIKTEQLFRYLQACCSLVLPLVLLMSATPLQASMVSAVFFPEHTVGFAPELLPLPQQTMVELETHDEERWNHVFLNMEVIVVQVFSASAMAFAHGANDVANVRLLSLSHCDDENILG